MLKRILFLFSVGTTILQAQDSSYEKILWEKSIGGEHSEYLYHALATPDYSFLLLGSSTSDATADKQKENQGGLDYFVWKIDENGNQEWQQSFGGDGNDFLTSGALTQDGGYILGGYTDSSKSGDKTEDNEGLTDYWILKLDASGAIQWQKTIGGLGNDELTTIIQTKDGGYLLGGNSDSPKSELKSEENIGAKDYWIVKLDSKGAIEWDKTLGGENTEELRPIIETKDSFILFGQTNSLTENNQFQDFDLEIIQLNKQGQIQQTLRYGSEAEDLFSSVYFDSENQTIHLAGLFGKEEGKELKIIQLDENLNQESESTTELNKNQVINSLILTKEKEYLLAGSKLGYSGSSKSIQQPISSYQAMILDQKGESKWNKELKSDGFDYLQTALETRDGSIILIGNSDSDKSKDKKVSSKGQQDFWIVKLGNKNQVEEQARETVEVYPNPTSDYVNVLINQDFKEAGGAVYNMAGQQLQEFTIQYRTTPVNFRNYPAGVYILKLTIDNKPQSLKIIKK